GPSLAPVVAGGTEGDRRRTRTAGTCAAWTRAAVTAGAVVVASCVPARASAVAGIRARVMIGRAGPARVLAAGTTGSRPAVATGLGPAGPLPDPAVARVRTAHLSRAMARPMARAVSRAMAGVAVRGPSARTAVAVSRSMSRPVTGAVTRLTRAARRVSRP